MTAVLTNEPKVQETLLGSQAPESQRWLHVVSHTDLRYGGLSSAVPAMAAALDRQRGIQTSLAAFCAPGESFQPPVIAREQTTFWPTSRIAWIRHQDLSRRLTALMADMDGVHVHGLWEESTAMACRIARRLGKPYVLSAHGMLEPWALNAKRLKKRLYAAVVERNNVCQAACLHALTDAEAEQYRRFGAKGPIAVVPNAVDLPKEATAHAFLDRFPELRGKRLVIFLSRLHPKKGLDLLLESWSCLSGFRAQAQLVIAGPDFEGMQARLTNVIRDRQLSPTVTFTGMLAGELKWSALKAAEAFVLPSYSEGLSMALLEAMGMGVPVIATLPCNMPEITSADAGWEIEPSAEALTAALRTLLAQAPEENAAKGLHGANLIADSYSTASVTQRMAAVYSAVLERTVPQEVRWLPGGEV